MANVKRKNFHFVGGNPLHLKIIMEDKHEYEGWLNSDSFMKRALAVAGYSTVGRLLILLLFGVMWGIGILMDSLFI